MPASWRSDPPRRSSPRRKARWSYPVKMCSTPRRRKRPVSWRTDGVASISKSGADARATRSTVRPPAVTRARWVCPAESSARKGSRTVHCDPAAGHRQRRSMAAPSASTRCRALRTRSHRAAAVRTSTEAATRCSAAASAAASSSPSGASIWSSPRKKVSRATASPCSRDHSPRDSLRAWACTVAGASRRAGSKRTRRDGRAGPTSMGTDEGGNWISVAPSGGSVQPARSSASRWSPRRTRVFTVPSGSPVSREISLCDIPSQ